MYRCYSSVRWPGSSLVVLVFGVLAASLSGCGSSVAGGQPTVIVPGVTGRVVVSGRVADGSRTDQLVQPPGIPATIEVLQADGTPTGVQTQSDAQGSFTLQFATSRQSSPNIILRATPTGSGEFKPVQRSVVVDGGDLSDVALFTSATVIQGTVLDSTGQPAVVDWWVMREDIPDSGQFNPYPVAGGRDFRPPLDESGVLFGGDTNPLGDYTIPVHQPDAMFRVVFVVDTNADRYVQKAADFFVPAGSVVRQDVRLELRTTPDPTDGDGEGGGGGDGEGGDSTAPVQFGRDIQAAIFAGGCAVSGCHLSPGPAAGLDLSASVAYANLVDVASVEVPTVARIKPNDPANSYLLAKVSGTQGEFGAGTGSQMPLGGQPLSQQDLDRIRSWIAAGAPDN